MVTEAGARAAIGRGWRPGLAACRGIVDNDDTRLCSIESPPCGRAGLPRVSADDARLNPRFSDK